MNIYGLTKKSTVDTSRGRLMLEDEFNVELAQFIRNNVIETYGPVDVEGYINNGCVYIAPYNGRYGIGFVVCEPEYWQGRKSTKYMRMYYYITEKKGVEND